jgi:hypothetical protein
MKKSFLDTTIGIQMDSDSSMAFNPGYGVDRDLLTHRTSHI